MDKDETTLATTASGASNHEKEKEVEDNRGIASTQSLLEFDKKNSETHSVGTSEAMNEVVKLSVSPPVPGDIVEGVVIGQKKLTVYVDIHPWGTGIIYGREYLNARDLIKKINVGDTISAKVVEPFEDGDGYIELSLREARQAASWKDAETAIKSKEIIEIPVKDANKGGLILEWMGLAGFLPASQLKSEHYPRVSDGDKDKILVELKSLIGQKLAVSIIAADPKEGKLIFSEKSGVQKEKIELVSRYAVGDVLDGEVTGTVDFGIFIKVEDGLEGLVHISEMDWALVEDPRKLYAAGDRTKVQVIDVKDGKLSLSIKALKPNPWKKAEGKYKKGTKVEGVVIRYNKHGALVSVEEGIAGLIHVSEFESAEKLRTELALGKTYDFTITLFDAKEQRMALSRTGKPVEKATTSDDTPEEDQPDSSKESDLK
ncbi:MAG: 30S ribosomal protein S1 [Candidatus Vogelbacteria bacterium CG10_big_fil_rev_8_21_14_0_10_51_16]|uniref:30S ribosomal protein S1 n=1 Tax=Candidatus Vogelbacteria bacterium CG10_big_fil_rev_8_21_14_0_10_51_16 TaxID=1975045 RepID=A0A2H0RER8_9BACT|nr:MAG: 30S ribosomal protein S1 [Candidatus Vogelbacteria bacterium CG10_big_fil_rev_8_21_14_0_10_51_16]